MENEDTKSHSAGSEQLPPKPQDDGIKSNSRLIGKNFFDTADTSGVFALSPETGRFEPAIAPFDSEQLLARAKKMSGVALAMCSATLVAAIAICIHSVTTNENPFGDIFLAVVLAFPFLGCFIYACIAAWYVGKCKERGVVIPQYLRIIRVVSLLLVPISFILMVVFIV